MSLSSPLSKLKRPRRKVKPEEKPRGFIMRPLKSLARQVTTTPGFMPLSTATVTKGVVNDINFAFEHKWNITCVVIGGPGEGKSRAVWRLAKIWTNLTGGTFHYCWDIDEIPEVHDGDWLHIDEWFIPEGQGKLQALQRIKHLFDTGRRKMICISVSTPTAPNLPFVTVELTSLAQDFDARLNLFEVRVPLPRHDMVYIGNTVIPLGADDDKWLEYEEESYIRKSEVWDNKGKKIVAAKFDSEQLAKEVIDWAKVRDIKISSKGIATTLVRKLATEHNWDTNYATEPDIVNWVEIYGGIKKGPSSHSTGKPPIEGTFTEDWKGLREFIEAWCLTKDPPRKEYATATALWIVPETPSISQDSVFDLIDFGDNPVKVATLTREIRNMRGRIQHPDRAFTDFTESFVASQLDTLGARKVGGQDQPDIILADGNEIAVKFTVKNQWDYDYTVSPEKQGLVIIIIPRLLQFFVIPIKDNVVNQHLQLDNSKIRGEGSLVGIEGLCETVKEMVEK